MRIAVGGVDYEHAAHDSHRPLTITPEDIRHLEPQRSWLGGYRRKGVDALLVEIAASLEGANRERAEVAALVADLEAEASKHAELETLVRSTLLEAERAVQELKAQARNESDVIVEAAHADGRRANREVVAERQRLEEDVRKIRARLRAALETIEDIPDSVESRAEQPESQPADADATEDGGFRGVAG